MPTQRQIEIGEAYERRYQARLASGVLDEPYFGPDGCIWSADPDNYVRYGGLQNFRIFDPATREYISPVGRVSEFVATQEKDRKAQLEADKKAYTVLLGLLTTGLFLASFIVLGSNGSEPNIPAVLILWGATLVSAITLGIVNHRVGKQLLVIAAIGAGAYLAHSAYERHTQK